MRRSALSPVDQTTMISFDGGIAEPAMRQRPDRYRLFGVAVCSALAACHYEYICLTDADGQCDIADFAKPFKLQRYYDLIITFRYKKIYSNTRMFVSWVYNKLLRFMFRTPFQDVSTGSNGSSVDLQRHPTGGPSPFIGAALAINAVLRGYRVREVGIQTFPRTFGRGSSTSPKNILATMVDMWRIGRNIFSDEYELAVARRRT